MYRIDPYVTVIAAQNGRQEASQDGFVLEIVEQPGTREPQRGILAAREQIDRQTRKQLEGYHRRNRIPRQTENGLAADFRKDKRLAGLNRNAGNEELRSQITQRTLDEVILADRNPAGEKQEVGSQAILDQVPCAGMNVRRNG